MSEQINEIPEISKPITQIKKVEDSEEENINHGGGSNYSSEEDSDVPELESTFKNNSELYIVTQNGIPKFYTKSQEDAKKQMWSLARALRFQEFQYNTYIRERLTSSAIEVVGYNKFSFIQVDRIIHWFRIECIKQLEYNTVSDDICEEKEKEKKHQEYTSLWNIFG